MKRYYIAVARNDRFSLEDVLGCPCVYYHELAARSLNCEFFLLAHEDKREVYSEIFPTDRVFSFHEEKLLLEKLDEETPIFLTYTDVFAAIDEKIFTENKWGVKFVAVTDKRKLPAATIRQALAASAAQDSEDCFPALRLDSELDVTYLRNLIKKKINADLAAKGVVFSDLEAAQIGPLASVEAGAVIKTNVVISGSSWIETDAVIEEQTKIESSIIGTGTHVYQSRIVNSKVGSHNSIVSSDLDSCSIGDLNQIGPFARLRGQTQIDSKTVVGNFVELKGSSIKNNVKIKHLSYIGDTFIEKNANIGCGVITANYDGRSKFQTKIGEHCFVGCNSTLVAPVSLAKDSYVAAGSTVTEDVGEGELAIARSRQINKAGYVSKKGLKQS